MKIQTPTVETRLKKLKLLQEAIQGKTRFLDLGVTNNAKKLVFKQDINSYLVQELSFCLKSGDIIFDVTTSQAGQAGHYYNYAGNITSFLKILSFVGLPVYGLSSPYRSPDDKKEGLGNFLGFKDQLHGFTTSFAIVGDKLVHSDGALFKAPEAIKEHSKKYKEYKKARKEVKGTLDMLLSVGALTEIAKQYPVEKYTEMQMKAGAIYTQLSAKNTTASVFLCDDLAHCCSDNHINALDQYIASLVKLAKEKDPITAFMSDTLPVMAGIYRVSKGHHMSVSENGYPTLKGLGYILNGHYSQKGYYKGQASIKQLIRGVDRIAEFFEDSIFTYTKVKTWDGKPMI